MISYRPLAETLRKRGIGFSELLGKMGVDSGWYRRYMNGGRYVSLRTIDRICAALECGVGDVISWEPGEMVFSEPPGKVRMRWDVLEGLLDVRNLTEREIGPLVGKSASWWRSVRGRGLMGRGNARRLVEALGGKWEECVAE